MRKKLFTFLLALVTSVGLSWAQNPSGSCGENLSWEFNPSTGTLTITGSGAMTDWASANSRPWHSYQSDITSLSLPEGLTYIGRSAFQECQMTSVELPNSLEEIGRAAFCACGLTSVTIPDNVHTIGWSAFASCQNLSTITIGSGVTSIGYFAFSNLMIEPWPSRKLESVTCYATTPPTCDYDESFSELWNKEQVPLYVPAESVDAYKAAEDWNGFDVQAISGGSTPATGLQVVEVTSELYNGWNSNSNPFTVDVLPGFQAVTYDEAMEWTEVPTSGTAVLVYRTNGDNARVIQFFDGTITGDYDIETDFNQIYENITIFGNRFFYTAGGGSTPAPASSVTAARFLYNYDCQRNPAFPKVNSACSLSGFQDPYEGYKGYRNGNIALGPWKIEFVAYYTPSNNYDCASQVNSAVYQYYSNLSNEEREAKKLEVPIFRLWQYNLAAKEYQPAAYGIVCAYAGEANAQDHAALFVSSNGMGCFLSGHQHTSSFALTCENDLTTGLNALVDAASAPSDPYYDVVWPVIVSIDAIGPVELSEHCKYYIEGSRAAYNALTDEQKAQVTNYSTLTDAEEQWVDLVAAAQPYADAVIDLINAIPDPVVYTQDCKDKIDAAQAAYDALTDGQKILVSNYETLKNAPSDLINAAPYVHILFTANNQERKVENVTLPREFTEAEMSTMLKELYGVEGDYDMYAYSNADAVNIIPYEKWTISPFMGKVNVNGGLYKYDPQTGFDQINFGLEVSLELPPFGPAPASTDEQVPTNADPVNPSYHYSTFFHGTQNYKLTNDGTQAFIATLSNNDLVLTKIAEGTQVIPANTAVIFRKSGSADPVVLTPTEENGVSVNPDDNDLLGVDAETAAPANCYVLSGTDQNGVGFYQILGNTLKAHKAYVIYTGSAAPKRMRFVFNQTTDVESIQPSAVSIQKILENGQVIIIRNGVRYNAAGQIVK